MFDKIKEGDKVIIRNEVGWFCKKVADVGIYSFSTYDGRRFNKLDGQEIPKKRRGKAIEYTEDREKKVLYLREHKRKATLLNEVDYRKIPYERVAKIFDIVSEGINNEERFNDDEENIMV